MRWMATGMLAMALMASACGGDDGSGGDAGDTDQTQAASAERTAAIERLVAAFQQTGATADQACILAALSPYSDDVVLGIEQALGSGGSDDADTSAALTAMARCVTTA